MPQIETWPRIPAAIRDRLAERMHDRNISLDDLNRLQGLAGDQTKCSRSALVQRFWFIQTLRRGKISQDISSCRPGRDWRKTLS